MLKGLSGSGWHLCSIMMRMMFDGFIGRTASLGSPGRQRVALAGAAAAGRRSHARCRGRGGAGFQQPSRDRHRDVQGRGPQRRRAWRLCEMVSPIIVRRARSPRRSRRADAFLRGHRDRAAARGRLVHLHRRRNQEIRRAIRSASAFISTKRRGANRCSAGSRRSGWHVGSVCMKLLVADGQRQAKEAARARREDRGLGTVAGLSRTALDQAGAGRRHHQLRQRGRIASAPRRSVPNGASCRPATPAPTSAANWCIRCWRRPSCRGGTPVPERYWLADCDRPVAMPIAERFSANAF